LHTQPAVGYSNTSGRHHRGNEATNNRKCSSSPTQVPRTGLDDEEVYVLTFQTGKAHHQRRTEVRQKYFPKHINKLAAHLTLFHALPGSRLDSDIIPVIQSVANSTAPFPITASEPFKLNKRGIAISVMPQGRAKQIREELQAPWKQSGFLSRQDASRTSRSFPHYTVMNKVDDVAEVQKALDELRRDFQPDRDAIVGLSLYRYKKGYWKWFRRFDFHPSERAEEI
jgi:hypothetical protein